ncbi:MAG: hypothetical protein HQ506_08960 [Candidatus Marinimicrobia bacterium]|nr:hypothetical protein [Candidatus Neomarinimicrobiota bacterium]
MSKIRALFTLLFLLMQTSYAEHELGIGYDLNLVIQPQAGNNPATIAGTNHISIINHWNQAIDTLYINNNSNAHYKSNDPGTPRTVILSTLGTEQADTSEVMGSSMSLRLLKPLLPGDSITIDIEFETRIASKGNPFAPSVGTEADTIIYNLIFFYPIVEYFHPDGWRPEQYGGGADPHVNLADFQVEITYPDSLRLGVSGFTTGVDTTEDHQITQSFTSPASHSVSMVLSNHFERKALTISGVEVEFLYTPGEDDHVDSLASMMVDMVPFMESWFGPCPSKRLLCTMSYSLGELAGALATTNFIVYQRSMKSKSTLSHELGHHWFAGSIIGNENTEPWLNEGFAEYGSRLWFTETHPDTGKSEISRFSLDLWSDIRNFNPEDVLWLFSDILGDDLIGPIQLEQMIDWTDIEDATSVTAAAVAIYYKSSNLLQVLQAALGESQMQDLMLTYTDQYRGQEVTQSSFLELLTQTHGPAVSNAFKKAVNESGRPNYSIKSVHSRNIESDLWETKVALESQGPWELPVTFVARSADGSVLEEDRWIPNTVDDLILTTVEPIASISIDPQMRSMDRIRFDNHWPRRFQIQPFAGLPGRDEYRIFVRPRYSVDQQGQKLLGVRFKGSSGIDLGPLTASSFRNALTLDAGWQVESGAPQVTLRYKQPLLNSNKRFIEISGQMHHLFNNESIVLTKYLGQQAWYFDGGAMNYRQSSLSLQRWEYTEPGAGEVNLFLNHSLTFFQHNMRDRSIFKIHTGLGASREGKNNLSTNTTIRLEVKIHKALSKILMLGIQGGIDYVNDNSLRNDLGLRSGILPMFWDMRVSPIVFRGHTSFDGARHQSALPLGVSLGLGSEDNRFDMRPIIYSDFVIFENEGGSLTQRWAELSTRPVSSALGLGMEASFAADIGLYFPLWLSHPPTGEENWGLRVMLQLERHWD